MFLKFKVDQNEKKNDLNIFCTSTLVLNLKEIRAYFLVGLIVSCTKLFPIQSTYRSL